MVGLFGGDGGIIHLAGDNGIVVALRHNELDGIIAAAHIVNAGQGNGHADGTAVFFPNADIGARLRRIAIGAEVAGKEAAVAGGGDRELAAVIAGLRSKGDKIFIPDIQGHVNVIAGYNFGAGGHIVGGVAGVFGEFIQPLLMIPLPVVAAVADHVQAIAYFSRLAHGALGGKYGSEGGIAGHGEFTAVCQCGFTIAGLADSFYWFVAAAGVQLHSDFGILRNRDRGTGG